MPQRGERDRYSCLRPCSARCGGTVAAERRAGAGPIIDAEPGRSTINKNSGDWPDPENWNARDDDTGRAERVRNT
jgi:hypothetical protein